MNAELGRVSKRIAEAITEYVQNALERRVPFSAQNVRAHVEFMCGRTAPGSADRVMRSLRQAGVINYRCVDRAQSLYEALPLAPQKPQAAA